MPLMASLAKAFSLLIAAHVQAIGLVMLAWWAGSWLNENHPTGWNWYAITFPVAVIAVIQTFYVVIRHAMSEDKRKE